MKRCAVALPLADGASLAEHREKMKTLAHSIGEMHPDVVIERAGPVVIIVQVPDDLVPIIRHSLKCFVDESA